MKIFKLMLPIIILAAACGRGGSPSVTPEPTNLKATEGQLDSLWNRAQAKLESHDWSDASVLLERLLLELPRRDQRLPLARIALGDARVGLKSYLQAVREYRRTADDFPTDSMAPVGLLKAGDSYAKLWRRPELDATYGTQAIGTWQELLTRYPQSPIADSARSRIQGLREWFALKEYHAAQYYVKYKAYNAAILYLKDLVATYPNAAVVPKALVSLVESYQELGYEEDVQEMCGYFRANHSDAPELEKTCPAAQVGSGAGQESPAGN